MPLTFNKDGTAACMCVPAMITKEAAHLMLNMTQPHASGLPWDFSKEAACPGHNGRKHFVFKLHTMEGD